MLVETVAVLWLFVPAYVANMAPVLIRNHLEFLYRPLDGGRSWRGIRILGDHKTWRGLLVGVAAGALLFELQRAIYAAGYLHVLALLDYGKDRPL